MEQYVVEQHYFETTESERRNLPRRVRARSVKGVVRSEIRKRRDIENDRIAAARIQDLIKGLEWAVSSLNGSIDAVLEGAEVREPSHSAYPAAARTMSARRDNILGTIAVLSGQLANINKAQQAD
jgi:hypothetical protein